MRVGYFFMFIAFVRQIVRQKNKRIIKTRYSSEFYKYIKGRLMGLHIYGNINLVISHIAIVY